MTVDARTAGIAPPIPDTFDSVADYGPLRDALYAADWPGVVGVLESWAPEEASQALALLAEKDDARISDLLLEQGEDPFAKVARARRLIELGWRARTHADASQVTPDQWTEFRRNLALAEHLLIEACAVEPSLTPAWTARVLTARALNLPESEARRRFVRASESGVDFWAQHHMLQYLEPKWFGSVDASRALVDEAQAAASEGDLAGVLVAQFHLERWAESAGPEGVAHLRRPEVQAELDKAARRSVLHPSRTQLTPSAVAGHTTFLATYWLAGEKRKAATHRDALGVRTSAATWVMIGQTEQERNRIWRELAMEGAERT